jgi:formate-dependent nitrite reductase membrane component NrfD
MKLYAWMVDYTPQTTWIEGHGILIWFAEVIGLIGGGLYLVSMYFNSFAGMIVGWLMIVLVKSGLHLAHLGKPSRFWRLFLRVGTSWLARGLLFVVLFAVFGALQLFLSYSFPGTGAELFFRVCAGVLALLVIAYSGFVMNYVNGIPFWNSALLPLLFVVFGILGGLAILLVVVPADDREALLRLIPLLVCAGACLLALYLWCATYTGPAAKSSVKELVQGRLALYMWGGTGVCGVFVPLLTISYMYLDRTQPSILLGASALGILVGVFSLTYCMLKAGVYRPLTPTAF